MGQLPANTDPSRISRLASVSSWGCFTECKTLTNTPRNLSNSREVVGTVGRLGITALPGEGSQREISGR